MTENKVSVIIPVYNGAAWIEECIRSVLVQTWNNFEILVMDDYSTDGTTRMVQEMAREDQRVRLILRDGKGVSAARNQGIRQSDGEFITFLDADDKLDGRMFEILINYMKMEDSDMVVCGYHRWAGDTEGVKHLESNDVKADDQNNRPDPLAEIASREYTVKTVNRECYVSDYLLRHYTHCWGVLYKRSVAESVVFREELTIGEDMMFLADLLPGLSKISITNYKGYYYRINEAGVTLRPFVPAYMDEIKSWKLAADMIRRDYPKCLPRVKSILAVSGILVAGKIAALSDKDRKQYQNYVEECCKTVKEALKVPGAKKNLPEGYRIKTMIFTHWPRVYLMLYHIWKSRS